MDNLCNVTTGKVRFSYVHLYKPYAYQQGQEEKYQATVLVPKSDVDTKESMLPSKQRSRKARQRNGTAYARQSFPIRFMTGTG